MATLAILLATMTMLAEAAYTPDLGLSPEQLDFTPRDYKIDHTDFAPKDYKDNKDVVGGKSGNTKYGGNLPPATSYQSFWMESKNAVPIKVDSAAKTDLEYPQNPLYLPPEVDHSSQLTDYGHPDPQSPGTVGYHAQTASSGYDQSSSAGPSGSYSSGASHDDGSNPTSSHTLVTYVGSSGGDAYQGHTQQMQGGDDHQSFIQSSSAAFQGYASQSGGEGLVDIQYIAASQPQSPSGFTHSEGSGGSYMASNGHDAGGYQSYGPPSSHMQTILVGQSSAGAQYDYSQSRMAPDNSYQSYGPPSAGASQMYQQQDYQSYMEGGAVAPSHAAYQSDTQSGVEAPSQEAYQNYVQTGAQSPSQVGYHNGGSSYGPPPQQYSQGSAGSAPQQHSQGGSAGGSYSYRRR